MMRFVTLIIGIVILQCSSAYADINPLSTDRWKQRPLIIISPNENDPMLKSINQALQDRATLVDFNDRAMVLYVITNTKATRNGKPLEPKETQAILDGLQQTQPYVPSAYLIGLDGGVKLAQQHRIDLQAIFTLIDGMPMRRQQIR